jgi:hypothetical protein
MVELAILVTTKRIVGLIGAISGAALVLILVLIIFSGGKLLRGSGWAHAMVIAAIIWIVAFTYNAVVEARDSRRPSSTAPPKAAPARFIQGTSDLPIRLAAALAVIFFAGAVLVALFSFDNHRALFVVLILLGVVLLSVATFSETTRHR